MSFDLKLMLEPCGLKLRLADFEVERSRYPFSHLHFSTAKSCSSIKA